MNSRGFIIRRGEGDCGVGKKMRICCIENSSGYKMKNDRIENRKLIGLQLKNPSG